MIVGETGGVVVVGDDGGYVRFHAPHLGSGLRRKDGGGGLRYAPEYLCLIVKGYQVAGA